MSRFNKYIIYVDESGDRELNNTDSPYFIQNFCIFDKQHLNKEIIPKIQQLKMNHFGHDAFDLSADNYANQTGAFEKFSGVNQRQQFENELNALVKHCNFVLIACVIDKRKIKDEQNIFDEAISFALDHIYRFLQEREQVGDLAHIVCQSQNANEDKVFHTLFRTLCDQGTSNKQSLPFDLQWFDASSPPLASQLIGFFAKAIRDQQSDVETDLFLLLKEKFYCKGGRKNVGEGYEGWGLKCFP